MRRLWIGLLLLLAVVGLCVVSQVYQHRQIDRLLETLDALPTPAAAEDFRTEYTRRTRLFPCFMSHADLSGIEETVAVLPAVAAGGDEDELRQTVALCRAQLERLRTTELPIWQNVF